MLGMFRLHPPTDTSPRIKMHTLLQVVYRCEQCCAAPSEQCCSAMITMLLQHCSTAQQHCSTIVQPHNSIVQSLSNRINTVATC